MKKSKTSKTPAAVVERNARLSVRDRLDRVADALTFIILSARSSPENAGLDPEMMLETVGRLAAQTREEHVWYLQQLPASMLDLDAPSDDERAAGGGR